MVKMIFSWIASAACFFTAASAVETVTVGENGNLTFDPPYLSGYSDGGVEFLIYRADPPYKASQSTFEQPCVAKPDGLSFGVSALSNDPYNDIVFGLEVDPGESLWFFVTNANRCAAGMVFAVNPTAQQTHEAFKAKAMSSGTTCDTSSPTATSANAPSASSTKSTSGSVKTSTVTSILEITTVTAGLNLLFQMFA